MKTKFWNGVFTYIAIESLIQDYYGKDAWLARAAEHWADASITVPVALIILVAALWDYAKGGN